MARVVITPIEVTKHSTFEGTVLNSALFKGVDVTNGAEVVMDGHDERTVIMVQNTATAPGTVTVKAGNGIQGVADEVFTVPASSTTFIVPESGRFKNVSGDDKGKLIINGSAATITVAVIKLP